MNRHGMFYSDYDYRNNNGPTMMYGQDVVDGYKRLLKECTEENSKLRAENASLLNQVRQLKRARSMPPST